MRLLYPILSLLANEVIAKKKKGTGENLYNHESGKIRVSLQIKSRFFIMEIFLFFP